MQVDQLKYLGSLISADGYCWTEIPRRIALDKRAFMNKKKLFTGNLSIVLEKRIEESVLWSVMLYASETRTMAQADEQPWKCGFREG